MDFEHYKEVPAINATAIKAGARSMLHMRHVMTGGEKATTDAMAWGSLVHAAILEPDRFFKSLAVYTVRKAGKAWDDFNTANDGKTIIGASDNAELVAISNAVHAKRSAHRLIEQSQHEVTLQWDSPNIGASKARLDGLTDDCVVELKTAQDISPDRFFRQCVNLRYDIQFGWYSMAAGNRPVIVIAVESSAPYDVAVYQIPRAMVDKGRRTAVDIASRYRACERAGEYPGQQGLDITELPLPEWYAGDVMPSGLTEMAASELE
jgi:hypothetical protein